MLQLRDAVTSLFLPKSFDVASVPSAAALADVGVTIGDLSRMTGAERKKVLEEAGVGQRVLPLFFRALHHLTALHPHNVVDGHHTECFPPRSANNWAPTGETLPLAGRAYVLSRESKPVESAATAAAPPVSPARSPTSAQRSVGFIGLKNQGSTCYLNSLLQLLFHLTEFRYAIYNVNADPGSVTGALQKVFFGLESQDEAVETTALTASFGWSSSDAFVQHDIHELTRILLDNLEEKLKAVHHENVVKSLFSGTMESFVKVRDTGFESAHDEAFYDVQLVVQGCLSIYDSFDKLFQPNILEGNNRYCLEVDGRKSYHDAEMGVRFKECPPVLLCHLTRFDFDYERGEMCKVLTRWDFYETIDLTSYLPSEAPKHMGEYTLHGVVVHSGADARFGHYYCFVRHGAEWLKFNDDLVTTATRREVFGSNFGGTKTSYWGAPIPLTTNAYMLVYVRTADLPRVVGPAPSLSIPTHLIERMDSEQKESERRRRERAEEHMFVKVHFVTHSDLITHPRLVTEPAPTSIKFPPERSVRAPRVDRISCLREHATNLCPSSDTLILVGGELRESGFWRLQRVLEPGATVESLCARQGDREAVVAAFPSAFVVRGDGAHTDAELIITHHKIFLPIEMRCVLTCSLLVSGLVATHVQSLEPLVRQHAGSLPLPADVLSWIEQHALDVVVEAESGRGVPLPAELAAKGAVYVWQPRLSDAERADCFYTNVEEFQQHLQHKTSVKFLKLEPPHFPEVHRAELSLELTYEQVQRYLARKLEVDNFDLIRFSRHNPETNSPFFMKVKKRDKSTLRKLLTSSQQLQSSLYFEIGKFTVRQMEESNPLIFEFFDDVLRPVSTHTVLMPMPGEFTAAEMLETCRCTIGDAAAPPGTELWLLDVWQGKIYNIYTRASGILKEKFEESAEYRVEAVPKRIGGVPPERQLLIHVQHVTRQGGKLRTHGDPCSLYTEEGDTYDDFLDRLSRKVQTPVLSMVDWKPLLIRNGNDPVDVDRAAPLAAQYQQLLNTRANEPCSCYLGLEHAPLPTTRRQIKREERALKIYN